ncbi:MAG: WYL domain-containing protein [Leptolyngbyaceae cyanobacterium RM1_406_9]|nr:WYL domain-containing protein [Leptolyngbyaceae cyanobacterium RM1_406_9]
MEFILLIILTISVYLVINAYQQKKSEQKVNSNRIDQSSRINNSFPPPAPKTIIDSGVSSQSSFKGVSTLGSKPIQGRTNLLEWAIQSSQKVQFSYKEDNEKTIQVVTPIELKTVKGTSYLEAYCNLTKARRTFVLSLIEEVHIVSTNATISAPISPPQNSTNVSNPNSQIQQRPYKNNSFDELEKIACSNWNNLKTLNEIDYELRFRSHKKAQALHTRILQRLIKPLGEKFSPPHTTVISKPPQEPLPPISRPEGLLSYCGYKVGANGLPESQRRQILDKIFLQPLPYMKDSLYLSEWGEPNTYKRLKKLAESIAAFTRNAKRRKKRDLSKAIQEWESDLAYLKRNFYDNDSRFDFNWPSTSKR